MGDQSSHEAKGIAADFFCAEGVEWSIGAFKFKWLQESLTLLCLLNGIPLQRLNLKHCDNEKLAKEFSAGMVNEFCFAWVRDVAEFKRSLGPEPRDRHL